MSQAFVIVLREGFEAFLVVAIIFSYLQRKNLTNLFTAVYCGIVAACFASVGLGFWLLKQANEPLWEGIFGLVAAFMVTTLVIQMWREGKSIKANMEKRLDSCSEAQSGKLAWLGIFLFTTFMLSREGMETALMLIQVPRQDVYLGAGLGILVTAAVAFLWVRFNSRINLTLFFQVTGIFLLLFVIQIIIYSLHELSESGLISGAEAFHEATEPFSPGGLYGRWFSPAALGICAVWLLGSAILDKINPKR